MLPIKIDLPEGFLEEEVRCGYTVSAEIKKLWAVELDLLAEFDRVCRKNNLTYCAFGGTLLGAVRHKGFIPWDDDIDLLMPRRDYGKLQEIAVDEFRNPYFFQNILTDTGLVMGGSRLRNSNTTICNESEWIKPFENKGIFIDIFVLDNVPDSELKLKFTKIILKAFWRMLRFASYYELYFEKGKSYPFKKRVKGRLALALKHIFGVQKMQLVYESLCMWQNRHNTKRVAPLTTFRGKFVYQREWCQDIFYVPFEHIQVPVTAAYDEMLTTQYGDYRVPKKISSTHSLLLFDAEVPYKDYSPK